MRFARAVCSAIPALTVALFASPLAAQQAVWDSVAPGVSVWNSSLIKAPTKSSTQQQAQMSASAVEIAVVRVDGAKAKIRLIDVYRTVQRESRSQRVASFELASIYDLTPHAIAMLNGGATTSFSVPSPAGLLKTAVNGVASPIALKSEVLNGVFCVPKSGSLWNIKRATDPNVKPCYEALQAGPILVKDGESEIKSTKARTPLARRSALCIDKKGKLYLAATGEITLYDLAKWLAASEKSGGLNCKSALNLDGDTSSGLIIRNREMTPFGEVRSTIASAIAVLPR